MSRTLRVTGGFARCRAVAPMRALLVERYDRVLSHGQVARLHQEDFCQALGLPPEWRATCQQLG